MLIKIKNDFEEEVIEAQTPVVVDYSAAWCNPCKMMSTALEEMSITYQNIKFCKVDVDENANLAEKYSISSLPTLVFFENGQEIRRITGMRPQATLEKFISGDEQ